MDKSHQQKPTGMNIKPWRPDFALTADAPYDWYQEEGIAFCLNGASMLLPVGEQYFIESVKYYKHDITDPILRDQVAEFIAQEALHSHAHALFNRVLIQKNKYLVCVETLTKSLLKLSKTLPARSQLAVTCALEHFTALFANVVLSHFVGFTNLAHPAFGKLWTWHAIEEIEHKAVCFDVYQAVAGGIMGYIERCLVMLIVTIIFSVVLLFGVLMSLFAYKKHRVLKNKEDTKKSGTEINGWHWVFRHLIAKLFIPYVSYYSPFFHPWNEDNSYLVTQWKAKINEI